MNDLSHIGRPGANEERMASARWRICHASERERGAEKYFRARGSAQVIGKAQFGQGNPRKTEPFPLDCPLRGLCPATTMAPIAIAVGSVSRSARPRCSRPAAWPLGLPEVLPEGVRALGLTPRVGGSPSGEEYGIVLHNNYGMCFIGNGQGRRRANASC
jgi:hypothetical protein